AQPRQTIERRRSNPSKVKLSRRAEPQICLSTKVNESQKIRSNRRFLQYHKASRRGLSYEIRGNLTLVFWQAAWASLHRLCVPALIIRSLSRTRAPPRQAG